LEWAIVGPAGGTCGMGVAVAGGGVACGRLGLLDECGHERVLPHGIGAGTACETLEQVGLVECQAQVGLLGLNGGVE